MENKSELHPSEIAKLEIEREQLLVDIEKTRVDIEHARIEVEQAKAEVEQTKALARGAMLSAEREALSLASDKRKEAAYLAGDFEHRVYRFNDHVDEKSSDRAIERLNAWDRLDPDCPMTIYINSPGGNVVAGMALFDEIVRLSKTHHITTVASGYAASMGGVLLQSGTKRVMAKESWLLLHQGSMMIGGSMGEVEDFFEWGKKIGKRIIDIFHDRSQASDAPKKLSKKQIEARMDRKDWWIDSETALSHGLVDEVWS